VLGIGNSGCDVTFSVRFTLTVDFYLCDLQADDASSSVGDSGCPAADSTFLGRQSQEVTEKVTKHFSNWFVVTTLDKAVIEGLWDSIKSDFEHCSLTSLSGLGDCVQAGAWGLPVGKVVDAYKLVMALNDALKAGVGISDAWNALKLSKLLDPATLVTCRTWSTPS
jgi:hypothetical protein